MDPSSRSLLASVSPQQLVAILSLVGGLVLLQFPALQSRRGVESLDSAPVVGDDFKFSASSIEDPLAALRSKTIVAPDSKDYDPKTQVKSYTHWGFYLDHLLPRAPKSPKGRPAEGVQVICVLLKPFLKTGFGEHRHRARNAVISALAAAGYAPDSPRTMFCCALRNIAKGNEDKFNGKWTLGDGEIKIPFEWFKPISTLPSFNGEKKNYSAICVMWCDYDEVRGRTNSPIARTRKILYALLTGYPRPKPNAASSDADIDEVPPPTPDADSDFIDTAILGPHDSFSLELMALEHLNSLPQQPRWSGQIRMASPYATSAAKSIVEGDPSRSNMILKRRMNLILKGDSNTNEDLFVRIPLTDDIVAEELFEELKRRGVHFPELSKSESKITCSETPPSPSNDTTSGDIVLISEFDTEFGRNLPLNLLDAAGVKDGKNQLNADGSRWHWFTFTRGLDGRFGTTPDKSNPTPPEGSSGKSLARDEPRGKSQARDEPRGTIQADALRRLAESLRELHDKRRGEGKPGIVAVGVLGGDVFDKLLVLRALRPALKDSLFFTNNLDAWFWDPQELDSTRNLVVASPFGLRLGERWQGGILPFRDSYQTSAYLAALSLAAKLDGTELEELVRREGVRLYEIGRNGPVDLSATRSTSPVAESETLPSSLHPESHLGTGPWPRHFGIRHFFILIGSLFLCSLPYLSTLAYSDGNSERKPGDSQTRLERWIGNSLIADVSVVLAVVLVTGLLWHLQRKDGEVFSLWDGVSAWPWFAITLAAVAFSVLMAVRSLLKLEARRKSFDRNYFYDAFEVPEEPNWKHVIFPRWTREDVAIEEDALRVASLWRRFSTSGRWKYRVLRTSLLAVIAMFVYFLFVQAMPVRIVPVRGQMARALQLILELSATFSFAWLGALVFDALCLNRKLISWLEKGTSDWSAEALARHALRVNSKKSRKKKDACGDEGESPVSKADRDYVDLSLVGDWTKDMAKLTSYPFVILALLLLARIPYFDDWRWSTPANLLYLMVVVSVISVAYRVHKAAEHLRSETLTNLRKEPATAGREKLESRINSLSIGAFAPFYKQPVMEAFFWLLSAIGVTGLWQAIARLVP